MIVTMLYLIACRSRPTETITWLNCEEETNASYDITITSKTHGKTVLFMGCITRSFLWSVFHDRQASKVCRQLDLLTSKQRATTTRTCSKYRRGSMTSYAPTLGLGTTSIGYVRAPASRRLCVGSYYVIFSQVYGAPKCPRIVIFEDVYSLLQEKRISLCLAV